MEFGFTKEEEVLVAEICGFIQKDATSELIEETLHLEGIYWGKGSKKVF